MTGGDKPKVLIMADVSGWAWDRKALQLKRYLSDEFDIEIQYTAENDRVSKNYDLYHTFEFPQVGRITWPEARILTGITAHVMATWGLTQIRNWADRAVAIHANSLLLFKEIKGLHSFVYYTPNGVCPEQFCRTRPLSTDRLIVGHVGKPNPRKGAKLIAEACNKAGVELRLLQRRFSSAIDADAMREWYQDVHVIAVASDMDGTPNPALEGSACESTVISNKIGNMPEFIKDGQNGFLVDRSVKGLQSKISLLKNNINLAIEMGRDARKTVLSQWTWKQQAENYRRMWWDALS